MDDQGFDFRKSPERREPKRFEPPPWERDAFPAKEPEERGGELPVEAPVEAPVTAPVEEPVEQVSAEKVPSQAENVPSEAEMIELLAGLAQEEPDTSRVITNATLASVIGLTAFGMVLLVWGMAAFVRAGAAAAGAGLARTGAATMGIFGAGFIASAMWLLYRLMKQRGVL